ncbi:MAG: sensor histidine kinase [Devosia sp.]
MAPERDHLAYRLKQQRILAQLGRLALQEADYTQLLQRCTELCAEGLDTPYCKILEFLPSKNVLLLQAGVGWAAEEIGHATLSGDVGSPAGFAFHTGESVLSNHLMAETRFRTPQLLADYGIKRAVNVLVDLGGPKPKPFGVLEVDSAVPGQFDEADVAFLAGCAGVLGAAIERYRNDIKLQAANERLQMMTREMSHRIKNSLGVVSSLLRLGANSAPGEGAKAALLDAEHRVMTIAHVHNHLWQGDKIGEIDLGAFLGDLCAGLSGSVDRIEVRCQAQPLVANTDYAIPLGLIVNELVTNAIKYAYEPEQGGVIDVALSALDKGLELQVSDYGKGLPADFDIGARRKSFGMRVVSSLLVQLNGSLMIGESPVGTRFVMRFDPHARSNEAAAD